jgi:5S rRNA maturation endonuclease (ribonuclease M5)
LSTHLQERIEKIEDTIEGLIEASVKGRLIIVEGKKDADTLRELGVAGEIFTVKTGGKSFLDAATEIEALRPIEVILFLDFDRRGREGTRRLQQSLERVHIKVDIKLWQRLRALTGHEIQCVESLLAYLCRLRQKTWNQNII